MIVRGLIVAALVVVGIAGCSPDKEKVISMRAVRTAAADASPSSCPIQLDVPAALSAAKVGGEARFDSARTQVSASETPAEDPVAAQRSGQRPVDAAAGASIECEYRLGQHPLRVQVIATHAGRSVNLLAARVSREAHLTRDELDRFLSAPPGAGEVEVVGGAVAVGGLAIDYGDATILVSSEAPEVREATLEQVTRALIDQVKF
ncbi:hypothetical protein IU450_23490 [Nocardia abscessus]|uniref:hypothetical protein n=1 Tax=Nocardia abscessus TaxID=120957 RepID=UPI0018930C57|nr:hypothetical protein [Nocardia abscessus]MBF6338834.1 hypothetical protein [Nocardia abscessus]